MIREGSEFVCDPRPQERVLAVHPSAKCKRVAPGVSMWRVSAGGVPLGVGYSTREAWEAAWAGLRDGVAQSGSHLHSVTPLQPR